MDLQNCTIPKLHIKSQYPINRASSGLAWLLIILSNTFLNTALAGSYCLSLDTCGFSTITEAAEADCSRMAKRGFRCEGITERSIHSARCPESDPDMLRFTGCWTHYASYGFEVDFGYYSAITQIYFTGYDEQDNYDPEKQSLCPGAGNPIVIANGNKY